MTLPNDFQIGLKEIVFAGFCYITLRAVAAWTDEWARDIKRKWDRRDGAEYVDMNGKKKWRDQVDVLARLVALEEDEAKDRKTMMIQHGVHEKLTERTMDIVEGFDASIRTIPAMNEGIEQIRKTLDGKS